MTIYAYARVSTNGQILDAPEKIFSKKQNGAKTDRAALARLLAALESGDVPRGAFVPSVTNGRTRPRGTAG
jgi:DNA invertase Pin-like site-specific DNA recombinase